MKVPSNSVGKIIGKDLGVISLVCCCKEKDHFFLTKCVWFFLELLPFSKISCFWLELAWKLSKKNTITFVYFDGSTGVLDLVAYTSSCLCKELTTAFEPSW
jgi:hypothetical protein